ncbi:MAG: phosphate/phosphite/phosphonate ABC transporter substrate-binding protein [Candidatus Kapabacteria bacterium]|jgi:phosphonate transport system substrate-binding protein|nr:phosphate/phosphite/phosphonate ABC transporter substrate-binding protein [Candidatus Kapabacteria bacterium]
MKNKYMNDLLKTILIAFVLTLSGCYETDIDSGKKIIEIDFSDTGTTRENDLNNDSKPSLKLAIAAMTSPKETYNHYHELIRYISDSLGINIERSQKKTYAEVNNLLKNGNVDVAFICSGAYIAAEGGLPVDNIAVPMIGGSFFYHSYIITHVDNDINSFSDFKGKSFAFTDPLSHTGYVYARCLIQKNEYSLADYFSKTIFTNAHDNSIQAVARKMVDGACVHSSIFDYIKTKNPEKVKNIKIVKVSDPYGMPPIVVRTALNDKIKQRLRNILIKMNMNNRGRRILKSLLIDKYVDSDSTDYTSVRNCYESLLK